MHHLRDAQRKLIPRMRLQEARRQRGLSQQEVADAIGTTFANVSRWENRYTTPGTYYRRKLGQFFGKTEQELDLEPPASLADPTSAVWSVFGPALPRRLRQHLAGRDEELVGLVERLCTASPTNLVALQGLPGVGKTALAIAIIHKRVIRRHFADGILWVTLGPDPYLPALLTRWGTLLGVPAEHMATLASVSAWRGTLHHAVGQRRMLLVIDDAYDWGDIRPFMAGGPTCAYLLTTRFPNIPLDTEMRATPVTVVRELGEAESVELVRGAAPEVVEREGERILELVRAVGGLPLALSLLGDYLRPPEVRGRSDLVQATLEQIADPASRLLLRRSRRDAVDLSGLPATGGPSLKESIDATCLLLSETALAALAALADVFPPKPCIFSEQEGVEAAGCSFDALDALSDAGLLESFASEQYTLHPTIVDYARVYLSRRVERATK